MLVASSFSTSADISFTNQSCQTTTRASVQGVEFSSYYSLAVSAMAVFQIISVTFHINVRNKQG